MEEAAIHTRSSKEANERSRAPDYFRNLHDKFKRSAELPTAANASEQVVAARGDQHKLLDPTEPEKSTGGVLILTSTVIDLATGILAEQEKANSNTKGLNVNKI